MNQSVNQSVDQNIHLYTCNTTFSSFFFISGTAAVTTCLQIMA